MILRVRDTGYMHGSALPAWNYDLAERSMIANGERNSVGEVECHALGRGESQVQRHAQVCR
jgi:hypothetical protein